MSTHYYEHPVIRVQGRQPIGRQDMGPFPTLEEAVAAALDTLSERFGKLDVVNALEELFRGRECRVQRVMEWLPRELATNEDFLKMAVHVQSDVLKYVPDHIKDNADWESFLLHRLRNRDTNGLRFASERQKNSKDFAIKAVAAWGEVLLHCNASFRADMEVVIAAVRQNPIAIRSDVHRSLLRSRVFWKGAIASRPEVLQFAPTWVRDDAELVQLGVTSQPHVLKYATRRVSGDPNTVRVAVARRGMALVHAAPALRGNPAIVRLAIQRDPVALVCARDDLRCDYSGFVRRAALFRNWVQARLILVGARKEGEDSRCPFSWLGTDLTALVLHAFAAAHTAPTVWDRFLCPGDGARQAYYVW
jgi:hypothetical protein